MTSGWTYASPEQAWAVFAPRRIDNARMSPCGHWLAWSETGDDGRLWVAAADGTALPRVVVERPHPIRFHLWAPDGGGIVHVADDLGTGVWQLLHTSVDRATIGTAGQSLGTTRAITDLDEHADLLAVSPRRPSTLLLAVDDHELGLPHVDQYDLRTHMRRRVAVNFGTVDGWFTDTGLTVRAATAATSDGGFDLLHRVDAGAPWRIVTHIAPDAALTTTIVSLPDRDTVVLIGTFETDTTQLVAIDTRTGRRRVLGSATDADIERVLVDPRTGWPQAYAVAAQRRRWIALDAHIADDLGVAGSTNADVRVVDRSDDNGRWLLAEETPDEPTRFVCWDRRQRARHLASHPTAGRPSRRGSTELISVRARDGMVLHGYWRSPRRGTAPHPTVLLVHGGPWWRDNWVHDPWRDWIDELGFACLQINFRGSAGRGAAFAAAGTRHWGGPGHRRPR
ncbi:MAG: hypothetical protein QM733_17460 [Ilumatobacteraceae bacterium]